MELTEKQYAKYRGKTTSQLLKLAQDVFNAYIRKRDSSGDYFECISCPGTKHVSEMNAGHYLPVSAYGALRFNEDNNNGQCVGCNQFLDGNREAYRLGLVSKIGFERVQALELHSRCSHRWDKDDLIVVIEKYKALLK